jgi:hypothetical protein
MSLDAMKSEIALVTGMDMGGSGSPLQTIQNAASLQQSLASPSTPSNMVTMLQSPTTPITAKRCSSCKMEKSRSEFGSNKKKRDGLNNECKACATVNQQLRRAKRKKRKSLDRPTDDLSKFETDLQNSWKQVKANAGIGFRFAFSKFET